MTLGCVIGLDSSCFSFSPDYFDYIKYQSECEKYLPMEILEETD